MEGRQADAGEVEPVDRLVGDATDTSRDEDACVQDRVGGERCLRTRDLETEPAVGRSRATPVSFCAASIERSKRGLAKYEMFVLPTSRMTRLSSSLSTSAYGSP